MNTPPKPDPDDERVLELINDLTRPIFILRMAGQTPEAVSRNASPGMRKSCDSRRALALREIRELLHTYAHEHMEDEHPNERLE